MLKYVVISALVLVCLIGICDGIQCYKCKGDEECDFKSRQIYIENCTWATKCWGARIGGHFIRSCADDRCEIQIGLGSYIESKCCYNDLCNDHDFFFPNSANSSNKNYMLGIILTLVILIANHVFN